MTNILEKQSSELRRPCYGIERPYGNTNKQSTFCIASTSTTILEHESVQRVDMQYGKGRGEAS